MTLWDRMVSRRRGNDPRPLSLRIRALLAETLQDSQESRDPGDFEVLSRVKERFLAERDSVDSGQCAGLCLRQADATPDFDVPYIWAANFQESGGDTPGSINTLIRGAHSCRRVSVILSTLGERCLTLRDAELAALCFAKAILAQEPPRSSYEAYLYFAYICHAAGYGNAARSALRIAQRIQHSIDLSPDAKGAVASVVTQGIQPMVRALIDMMLERGRLD